MQVRTSHLVLALLLTVPAAAVSSHAEWPYDDGDVVRRGSASPVELGPRGGYDWDGDTFTAGAQLRIPLWRRSRFTLAPSGDLYNDGTTADWQANVDLLVSPGPRGGFYAGLGFSWIEDGREKRERAVNQVLGLHMPLGSGRTRSYLEARWTELNRDTVFRVVFGINVALFRY
jgi:hypothetical protein